MASQEVAVMRERKIEEYATRVVCRTCRSRKMKSRTWQISKLDHNASQTLSKTRIKCSSFMFSTSGIVGHLLFHGYNDD